MRAFTRSSSTLPAGGSLTSLLGFAMLALGLMGCGHHNGSGTGDGGPQGPSITSTSPGDTDTNVALNSKVWVAFDQAMTPLTSSTLTLQQGGTAVAGVVTTTPDGTSATFAPSASLPASTAFTATVTSAASSTGGLAIQAAKSWGFTTGTTVDTTAPQVTGTAPATGDTSVPLNTKVVVTFDEAMDPLTLTSTSLTLAQGATSVAGAVGYGPGTSATFTPTNALSANAVYTVNVTTGVKDLEGNALTTAVTFSFTTGNATARGPAVVGLGKAGNFAILAKTAISSVPTSMVTGDIGLGPAAATYITGFSLTADATNVFSTSTQIVGRAYAANFAVPTPANLTTAVANMQSAYTDAAGRPTPDYLELGTGNIGGKTLAPGLYKWTSTVTVPSDVTLSGGANDVWIFQTTGDLMVSAAKKVILSGGAQAKNIFWQVAGKSTFGAGAHFEGILLCKTDVTLQTGASMNGRVLAQTQVALQKATLTKP